MSHPKSSRHLAQFETGDRVLGGGGSEVWIIASIDRQADTAVVARGPQRLTVHLSTLVPAPSPGRAGGVSGVQHYTHWPR